MKLIINYRFDVFALIIISGFSIMWNNQRIGVIRPDVECTNGIIHVLEHPLLVESDIRIALSGVGRLQQFLIGNIAMVLIVQLLL